MKEDIRFREIEPESFVLGYPTPKEASVDAEIDGEAEAWFNWAFLDFWKSNYCNGVVCERQPSLLIKVLVFRYRSEGCRSGAELVCYRRLERWFWSREWPGGTDAIVFAAGGDFEPGTRNSDVAKEPQGFDCFKQSQRRRGTYHLSIFPHSRFIEHEIDYVSENSGRVAEQTSRRRGGEEEGK